jgi:hypothetical protein
VKRWDELHFKVIIPSHETLLEAFEAQQLLRNGTYDLPRMKKVLESQRVRILCFLLDATDLLIGVLVSR